MDTSGRIPWAVLGIPESASFDDARRAFRALVKTAHPDAGGDPAVFAALVDAFNAVTAQTSGRPRPPVAAPARRHRATPYDWANRPVAPAPRVWAEKAPARRPARPDVPRFADVLARQLAGQGAAAA
jgi:hypothetical protein